MGGPRADRFDLVIAGGRLLDLAAGTYQRVDVGVADGVIAAVEGRIDAALGRRFVDVDGAIVTPGLTDMHVHAYPGATFWGMDIDHVSLASGVTTVVDAGSAGPYNFEGLAKILRSSRLRAKAFLNIAPGGLATPYGELLAPGAADVEAAGRVARAYPDLIVGFKLRASPNTVGENAAEALAAVRRAADETGLKVMVHVSEAPPDLGTVLDHLRAGDVLTHCFTPYDNCVVGADGRPRAEVLEALARGVMLDVGHGSGSFSFPAAEAWVRCGERLPIVSTDLHRRSVLGPAFDMTTVMTKLLAAGAAVEDVIQGASFDVLKWAPGSRLGVGAAADLAVIDVVEQPKRVWDSRAMERVASRKFSCKMTTVAGGIEFVSSDLRVVGV